MALVSTQKGVRVWAKSKGISNREIAALARQYEKETGINLVINSVFYPNQHKQIADNNARIQKFFTWIISQKSVQ